MPTHLIFEGAELSGKSSLMSRVYKVLEKEGSVTSDFLDGCSWINSDIGIFGGDHGEAIVHNYLDMARILAGRSVMFEKLHISDMAYRVMGGRPVPDYSQVEADLAELDYKIVLTVYDEKEELINARLADRLQLYPHYEKIAKTPESYFRQQQIYRDLVKKSILPSLEVNLREFSNSEIQPLLDWIK